MQSAVATLGLGLFYLCLRGRLGDPHPCDARVGGGGGGRVRCALAVALVVRRLILRGRLGRTVRCCRRGILIVDRLYYRIIRLGFLLLLLCLRRFFLLLLSFLVL